MAERKIIVNGDNLARIWLRTGAPAARCRRGRRRRRRARRHVGQLLLPLGVPAANERPASLAPPPSQSRRQAHCKCNCFPARFITLPTLHWRRCIGPGLPPDWLAPGRQSSLGAGEPGRFYCFRWPAANTSGSNFIVRQDRPLARATVSSGARQPRPAG